MSTTVTVRHSISIFGQLLLFSDQSMREKAWRSRKRGAQATRAPHPACRGGRRRERRILLAGAAGELAGATRLRLRQAFERMHIL